MKLAILLFLATFSVHAKLIDKVVAVIDETIITDSLISRVLNNIDARKNISPVVFEKDKYTREEIVTILINNYMTREHLKSIGYIIGDDQVEEQINSTEKRLGLGRKDLLAFLESNNVTFDEYFELIRSTIEFNIFNSRVITPMVSVSDQEVKNYFLKENGNNTSLAFKYNLVVFNIPISSKNKVDSSIIKNELISFKKSGILADSLREMQTSELGEVKEDGLNDSVRKALKNVNEEEFSDAVVSGNQLSFFYIKKKDLVESATFIREKQQIQNKLFVSKSVSVRNLWFKGQENKHFIKYF